MSEPPVVSISCLSFNHAKYIRECLDSILMQKTTFPIEIVVHDDASTDETKKIIEEYALLYPDIIFPLYQEENQYSKGVRGIMATFNLPRCRGKYIALCECDDYWTDPFKLQKQFDLMERYSNASMCVALNTQRNEVSGTEVTDVDYRSDTFPLLFFENLDRYFHTSTFFIRKSVLDYVMNKYVKLLKGDTAIRYLLLAEGPFVVLNDVVSVYRITGSGIWTSMKNSQQLFLNYKLYNLFRRNHRNEYKSYYLEKEINYLNSYIRTGANRPWVVKLVYKILYYRLISLYVVYGYIESPESIWVDLKKGFVAAKNLFQSFVFLSYKGRCIHAIKLKLFFRNLLINSKARLYDIEPLEKFNKTCLKVLQEPFKFISYGPNDTISDVLKRDVQVPALCLYEFENSIVNVSSSCILWSDKLIVESYNQFESFNEGFVEWNDQERAVVTELPVIEIEEGFFLAGNGSYNWYHWLVELLPKLLFLDEVPTLKILVNSEISKYQSILDSLYALLKSKSYEIIFLNKGNNYKVNRLYFINGISYVPFNMNGNRILKVEDVFMRGELLHKLRKQLLRFYKIDEMIVPLEKIFIKRNSHRIPRNQDVLEQKLIEIGFRMVEFDSLTLEAQIRLMNNAKVVIGTSGAAFTNILFSHPKTVFISFMSEPYKEFSCFSNLANIFEVELFYYLYTADAKPTDHYSSKFDVDISSIIDLYNKALKSSPPQS